MKKNLTVIFASVWLLTSEAVSDELRNLNVGNEYLLNVTNVLTNNLIKKAHVLVTEKTLEEIVVRYDDELHVYDNNLRSKKRGNWSYKPFGCDGIGKYLNSGYTEKYKIIGDWANDKSKGELVGSCSVRIGDESEFTINGKKIKAIYVENVASYTLSLSPKTQRTFVQTGFFSQELGFWVGGEFIEKHDGRLFSHGRFVMEKYSIRR